MLSGKWNLTGSGIEPMSLALAGSFFSTEPSVKPSISAEFLNSVLTYLFNSRHVFFMVLEAENPRLMCQLFQLPGESSLFGLEMVVST